MTTLFEMIAALKAHYGDRYFEALSERRLNAEGNIVKRERDCIEELYAELKAKENGHG